MNEVRETPVVLSFIILAFSLFSFLTTTNSWAVVPVLNFTDIIQAPKTGNSDGAGGLTSLEHGAIITVWGNYLGSQRGNSKIFFIDSQGKRAEAAHYYYWKDADGTLPGGPSDLNTFHRMQEIAFSIPASVADGSAKIIANISDIDSNELSFTIKSGRIRFIKSINSGGNDSTGNGTWQSPWATLENVASGQTSKLLPGDILYSVGVGVSNGLAIGISNPLSGTEADGIFVTAYPGASVVFSGKCAEKPSTIYYYYSSYWNWSKISVATTTTAFPTVRRNRIIGVEITGPNVYEGYSGAIGGGCNGVSSCNSIEGGKYLGIYIHNYGSNPDVPTTGNVGTQPPYPPSLKNTWDIFHHLYYVSNRSGNQREAYEVAWNHLADNPISSGIHIYDQTPCGDWSGSMKIHHNVVKNQRGGAINVDFSNCANPRLIVPIEIHDNLLISETSAVYPGAAIQIMAPVDSSSLPLDNVKVFNNTIMGYGSYNKIVGNIYFKNNIVIDNREIEYFSQYTTTVKEGSNNLFFSLVGGTASPTIPHWASRSIAQDPLFTNPSAFDFSPRKDSPTIDAGTNEVLNIAPRDFLGQPRQSGHISIGAFLPVDEVLIKKPNKPQNLSVSH